MVMVPCKSTAEKISLNGHTMGLCCYRQKLELYYMSS